MNIHVIAWIVLILLGLYSLFVAAYRATSAWEWVLIVAYTLTIIGTGVYIITGGL